MCVETASILVTKVKWETSRAAIFHNLIPACGNGIINEVNGFYVSENDQ